MVLVVFPLMLLSVPARVSTRFNSLKHDISLLRFKYNADVNRRVDEFESALKNNTVGFKIVGMMVTSERVKGLVLSGIAAHSTGSTSKHTFLKTYINNVFTFELYYKQERTYRHT